MPDLKGTNEMSDLNEQMRAEFEAWFSDDCKSPLAVERNSGGTYKLMQAQSAWIVWQAARRQHGSAAQAVGKVRLFEYSGIARNGAFFEAELYEGAKVSDGDQLYTAPPVADAEGVQSWQQRCNWMSDEPATKLMVEAMKAEIAELRAALSRRPAAEQPAAEQAKAAHVGWRNEKDGRPAAAENALTDAVADVIEMYAESYDTMARIGSDGRVGCTHVAVDLRQNILTQVKEAIEQHLRAAPQAAQGEGLTIDSPEFRQLAHHWQMCLSTELESSMDALIAHIDAKLRAIAAHTRASDGSVTLMNAATGVIAAWDSSPVNNRDSLVTERMYELRQARNAVLQQAASNQQEGAK